MVFLILLNGLTIKALLMSQNKLHLTITQDGDTGWYKVEMRDHNCSYCCVYEPSVKLAMMYAEIWFAEADKREELSRAHGRAVQVMAQQDKYDSLD
jgi:hypothetical protein